MSRVKARGQFGDALLDAVDDVERIGAEALQHDAARHLPFAVELGQAAALIGPELDARHVLHQHGRAALVLEHDLLQVGDTLR